MANFKDFLINEDKTHLGHRVSDVLTFMQSLQDDMTNMGSRHLNKVAEEVVNSIRKILHTQWSQRSLRHLKELQKIGVAIQKTIEEKGDLKEILPVAVQSLENISGKLGVKVNDLKAPEQEQGEDISQDDFEQTGEKPEKQDPAQMGQPQQPQMGQQPQMDPNMPGQMPDQNQNPMMQGQNPTQMQNGQF